MYDLKIISFPRSGRHVIATMLGMGGKLCTTHSIPTFKQVQAKNSLCLMRHPVYCAISNWEYNWQMMGINPYKEDKRAQFYDRVYDTVKYWIEYHNQIVTCHKCIKYESLLKHPIDIINQIMIELGRDDLVNNVHTVSQVEKVKDKQCHLDTWAFRGHSFKPRKIKDCPFDSVKLIRAFELASKWMNDTECILEAY